MLARDIMTPDPFTADVTTTVADVVDTLTSEGFRHLPITDGHRLVGVVSDRDLRRFSFDQIALDPVAARARMRSPISALMSADPLSVDPEDDVDDVIELLIEHKVGALPVVDGDGQLVGIVSTIDVLKAAQGRLG